LCFFPEFARKRGMLAIAPAKREQQITSTGRPKVFSAAAQEVSRGAIGRRRANLALDVRVELETSIFSGGELG